MGLLHWINDFIFVPLSILSLVVLYPFLLGFGLVRNFLNWLVSGTLKNKVVVVTGASSGIGRELSCHYAKHGACLVLAGRAERGLRETERISRKLGASDVFFVIGDLQRPEDCKSIIEQTIRRHGKLDHLVLNTGLTHGFLMEEVEALNLNDIVKINFWAAVYPTYFALPHLKKSKGQIVVMSAVDAFVPFPETALFNASKAGVVNFFESLRTEIGGTVGITMVTLGRIESEATKTGKMMDKRGYTTHDKEMAKVQVGPLPVEPMHSTARAVMRAVKGDRQYLVYPYWYIGLIRCRIFAADLLDSTLSYWFTPHQKAWTRLSTKRRKLNSTGREGLKVT